MTLPHAVILYESHDLVHTQRVHFHAQNNGEFVVANGVARFLWCEDDLHPVRIRLNKLPDEPDLAHGQSQTPDSNLGHARDCLQV
jgi:hypothetical protein